MILIYLMKTLLTVLQPDTWKVTIHTSAPMMKFCNKGKKLFSAFNKTLVRIQETTTIGIKISKPFNSITKHLYSLWELQQIKDQWLARIRDRINSNLMQLH
jgi:hypothetical protein